MSYIPRPPGLWYWLGTRAMALVTRALADWRVEGAEHVPKEGPLIVVANHFSFLDPPLLGASFPRPLTFVAKAELWQALPSRLFCHAFGLLPIRRGEPDRAALRAASEVLKRGGTLGFFPEGTRGRELPKRLKQAHRGVAFLARASGAPIVPVGIAGTDVVNTPSDIAAYALKRPAFTVRIGAPFHLSQERGGRSSERFAADTDYVMAQIARLLPERYWGAYADQARELILGAPAGSSLSGNSG